MRKRGLAIGGWLILPAIGLALRPLWLVFAGLALAGITFDASIMGLNRQDPDVFALVVLGNQTLVTFYAIYVAFLFFKRHHSTPKNMIRLYLVELSTSVFATAISQGQGLGESYNIDFSIILGESIIDIFLAGIWIAYFLKSQRVQKTFVVDAPVDEEFLENF